MRTSGTAAAESGSRANSYTFFTEWRVDGTCGEVADVLSDPLDLVRWWPAAYLEVRELRPPDANGLGRRVWVRSKGWLPYTLAWELEVVDSPYPRGLTIVANGDFEGRGVWKFEQQGPTVRATFDWRLHVEKPLVRRLSFLLRPLFEANHRWAMARGEESLKLELARRRALSDEERRAVPAPPGPVTYAGIAVLGGAAILGGTLVYLLSRVRRRSPEA
jgi:hypothetical protein